MRTLFLFTILSLIFSFSSLTPTCALDNEPMYFVVDYMKVAPEMTGKYLKLENAWKKIHAARIEAGQCDGWSLQRIISPYGTSTEYNFLTVNRYIGNKKLAGHFEGPMFNNLNEILTEEELALVNETLKIRTHIKSEVWQYRNGTFPEDWQKSTIYVVNYFKNQPGKTGPDHGKMENDIWKPIHTARIEGGDMNGWGLYSMEMPSGSMMPYSSCTVDMYVDMEQYLNPSSKNYWEEVHPGKEIKDLIKQTKAVVDLLFREVRMVVDRTGF